jgi:putative ABC transport system ATP-binding protein
MDGLELREVVKHYQSGGDMVRAADSISLKIEPGQLVALYGPSGSGKTTLLLLAAGLKTPDAGQVLFARRDVGAMTKKESSLYRRRDVGFVFQSFHLMPHASALDNAMIKLPADGCTLREARQRAEPWLERVGLGHRLRHRAGELSMGERQRVSIARALANDPKLLLADEPTGNLDATRTKEILGLLREICHERNIPGLLVTHDAQAMSFADRVCALRDGRLLEELGAQAHLGEPQT